MDNTILVSRTLSDGRQLEIRTAPDKRASKQVDDLRKAAGHLEAIAQRLVNADTHFITMLSELHGFSEDAATKIFKTYRKLKCIKLDAFMGRWNVKHGKFLDRDVCERALNHI